MSESDNVTRIIRNVIVLDDKKSNLLLQSKNDYINARKEGKKMVIDSRINKIKDLCRDIKVIEKKIKTEYDEIKKLKNKKQVPYEQYIEEYEKEYGKKSEPHEKDIIYNIGESS